jgi:hypothetical protein
MTYVKSGAKKCRQDKVYKKSRPPKTQFKSETTFDMDIRK